MSTKDGGVSTANSLQGRGDLWPLQYDGRAVICGPYKDVLAGTIPVEEATTRQKKATSEGDTSGMVVWA